MIKPDYSFESWHRKQLQNPGFRRAYARYELPAKIAAQISLLRRANGMTQDQLARRAKTCLYRRGNARKQRATAGAVSIGPAWSTHDARCARPHLH